MNNARETIMLVDDNVSNLTIGKNLLRDKYNVFTLSSGEKLFKMLEKVRPDFIMLDIEMPEMDGYAVIKRLKADPKTAPIPVIFLTAKNDSNSELEGLSLGAVDYISKPFSPPLLMKRIELHSLIESQKRELKEYNDNLQGIVEKKTEAVFILQNVVLQTMAELVECRDDITGGHIERTRYYLQILVNAMVERNVNRELGLAWIKDRYFFVSAQLHDVGKITISDNILKKPGPLTPEEFEEMKTHTTFGAQIIDKIKQRVGGEVFLDYARIFALTHHEKWDGTGYPAGLAGEDIPLQGRLMAIADVYDALIAERPYKKPMSHERACAIIEEGKGRHFDPRLVDVFLSVSGLFERVTALSQSLMSGNAGADEKMELEKLLRPVELYPKKQ
ncbi:MAG: response regulator [Candidatus Accumulibacter sp.]|jgi:putative two-component system response regulator|nr:response regulator [Accumulibacter sp.]